MAQLEGGATFLRNVLLLKKNDCHDKNGRIWMPTLIEMSKIRTSNQPEQFKKDVEFERNNSPDMVKKHLEEIFPHLKGKGFSCAAIVRIDKDRSKFEFYGDPRVWDSNSILTNISRKSTLYLLEALDSDSTSGISASDSEVSEDFDFASGLQNLDPYEVQINPEESPLKGGGPCVFKFTPKPSSEVRLVSATFQSIGEISLEKLSEDGKYLGEIPASKERGWVPIILRADQGPKKPVLGRTKIRYGDPGENFLEEIVLNPVKQKEFYDKFVFLRRGNSGNRDRGGSSSGNSGGRNKRYGKQISRVFGSSQLSHVLSILIYTAARCGAEEFIKIIFNSSAGGVVFNSYKDNTTLPESVARDSGNDEIANYLEEIAKRFSQEIQNGKQFGQIVDWSELVKATEEAQTKMHQDTDEKHTNQVESGYSADVESSSTASSTASSDQEDSDCGVPPAIDSFPNESSEKTFTSCTVMSRRTKDSARGSVVRKNDEAAEDFSASLNSFEQARLKQVFVYQETATLQTAHGSLTKKSKSRGVDIEGLKLAPVVEFASEFGDVKETTTEGDNTSSVADKGFLLRSPKLRVGLAVTLCKLKRRSEHIRIFDQPVESGQMLSFCSSLNSSLIKFSFCTNDGFNISSAGLDKSLGFICERSCEFSQGSLTKKSKSRGVDIEWLKLTPVVGFASGFGDVKETTTEGDNTSIVTDKARIKLLLKFFRLCCKELVPTVLQTEEDQTDEKDAKS